MKPWIKSTLLRAGSFIYYTIAIIVSGTVIWFAAAFIFPFIKVNTDRLEVKDGIEIFISSNGVHTDFVVPARTEFADLKKLFPTQTFEAVDSSATYIAFGWGDKKFYLDTPTWNDLTFATAFQALAGLGESAMHVTYYRNKLKADDDCKRLVLSEQEFKRLLVYIITSFERDNGKVKLIDHPGYSKNDNFYEAEGTYNLIKTCNVWTGEGLKKTGVPVGIWTPMESGVLRAIP